MPRLSVSNFSDTGTLKSKPQRRRPVLRRNPRRATTTRIQERREERNKRRQREPVFSERRGTHIGKKERQTTQQRQTPVRRSWTMDNAATGHKNRLAERPHGEPHPVPAFLHQNSIPPSHHSAVLSGGAAQQQPQPKSAPPATTTTTTKTPSEVTLSSKRRWKLPIPCFYDGQPASFSQQIKLVPPDTGEKKRVRSYRRHKNATKAARGGTAAKATTNAPHRPETKTTPATDSALSKAPASASNPNHATRQQQPQQPRPLDSSTAVPKQSRKRRSTAMLEDSASETTTSNKLQKTHHHNPPEDLDHHALHNSGRSGSARRSGSNAVAAAEPESKKDEVAPAVDRASSGTTWNGLVVDATASVGAHSTTTSSMTTTTGSVRPEYQQGTSTQQPYTLFVRNSVGGRDGDGTTTKGERISKAAAALFAGSADYQRGGKRRTGLPLHQQQQPQQSNDDAMRPANDKHQHHKMLSSSSTTIQERRAFKDAIQLRQGTVPQQHPMQKKATKFVTRKQLHAKNRDLCRGMSTYAMAETPPRGNPDSPPMPTAAAAAASSTPPTTFAAHCGAPRNDKDNNKTSRSDDHKFLAPTPQAKNPPRTPSTVGTTPSTGGAGPKHPRNENIHPEVGQPTAEQPKGDAIPLQLTFASTATGLKSRSNNKNRVNRSGTTESHEHHDDDDDKDNAELSQSPNEQSQEAQLPAKQPQPQVPPAPSFVFFFVEKGRDMHKALITSLQRRAQQRGARVLSSFSLASLVRKSNSGTVTTPPVIPTHFIFSNDPFVTIEASAQALRVSVSQVQRFVQEHSITCVTRAWITGATASFADTPTPTMAQGFLYRPLIPWARGQRGGGGQPPKRKAEKENHRTAVPRPQVSSTSISDRENGNSTRPRNLELSKLLERLSKIYQEAPLGKNDSWRSYSFQLMSGRVRYLDYEITVDTIDRVSKLRGVGDSILSIIKEYLDARQKRGLHDDGSNADDEDKSERPSGSGKAAEGPVITVNRLRNLNSDPERQGLRNMVNIWGVGRVKGTELVNAGFRTASQVRTALLRGKLRVPLCRNQCVGLLCYEDLLEKMGATEVEAIAAIVHDAIVERLDGAQIQIMGSYRRRKGAYGDVDILITHKKYEKAVPAKFLGRIVELLMQKGHIAFHLTKLTGMDPEKYESLPSKILERVGEGQRPYSTSEKHSSSCSSYMGVFNSPTIPGKRRRVDIKFYPYRERAFAMLYFTGNGHFNRSMRLWSTRKFHWTLNDHGLYVRHTDNRVLENADCEKAIFDKLGLVYKEPNERDSFDAVIAVHHCNERSEQGSTKQPRTAMDLDGWSQQEFKRESEHQWID